MLEPRPRNRQRPSHVVGLKGGVGQQPLPDLSGLCPQRAPALRRQGQRHHARDHRRSGGALRLAGDRVIGDRLLVRRSLFHDHMRVRAAHAEGGHARAPGQARLPLGPVPRTGEEFDGARRPVHFGRRGVHVQRLRQDTGPQRHDHLDHTGDTCGGLRVPDVGLQRAQPQGPFLRVLLAVGGEECLCLDRVAERRARAVRLHRVDITGREARVRQRGPDDAALRRTVGRGQAVARAVLIDRGAAYDREHPVAVAPGVGQPLDQQHADALAPARAVRGLRERLAPAVRLRRQVQGDQRRRARRVHRHRRSLEAEDVGEAAGHDAGGVAGEQVPLDAFGGLPDAFAVALVAGADEHARAGAAQGGRVDAGPLDAGRDAEERGVEVARVVQEAAVPGVEGALLVRVGVVAALDVPAAAVGQFADGVGAVGDEPPQVLGPAYAAGEAAAHADDRDGLPGSRRELLVLPSQPLGLLQRRAQRFNDRVRRARHVRLHIRAASFRCVISLRQFVLRQFVLRQFAASVRAASVRAASGVALVPRRSGIAVRSRCCPWPSGSGWPRPWRRSRRPRLRRRARPGPCSGPCSVRPAAGGRPSVPPRGCGRSARRRGPGGPRRPPGRPPSRRPRHRLRRRAGVRRGAAGTVPRGSGGRRRGCWAGSGRSRRSGGCGVRRRSASRSRSP
ncbi:putative Oleandomycin polyketide synthase, modules 5 and 6 [Streptomyces aurantiacus JA 4570]|uniref:Putative Oleandomycin polyketide synthase, modules 5 and 6 n=1 Tax=Streptomyces aurantiacus JA 4570 TaxID=1286094 RepID=S3ZS47_9ACTN|nr:putative Oleandomycin polyketide synthase, modules 5 and 6 [Streptomyces aurantiacus JA 4570]